MSNLADNQEAGVEMVKDMSSPGLLHSWSNSGVLNEVSVLLHQFSTHVFGYMNVPSPNCGSNLSKGLNNLSNSNRLTVLPAPKSSKKVQKKKSEVKPKKVDSVSFLDMLFFMLLYDGVLTIDGPVNGTDYPGKYDGKDHSLHYNRGGKGESNQQNTNKVVDEFVHGGNGSNSLAASLYVPSNDKLVEIHGNSIIQCVFSSKKAMASHGSVDKKNSEAGLVVPGDLAPAVPGIHPCLY
ncbi:hypothetical protein H5410_022716 [Solanum commersonii]|uniref:Uncharacterized protein n=1 Tax=Solanum commersonii TaxID=4109 RepID=A0A9J5ZEU0_SOLCO|nr:hypothetical protein H5410_022716 [Solanum commersonii]